MSTMKFCRECNNILYPKEDREQKMLLYACRNCDHQVPSPRFSLFVSRFRAYLCSARVQCGRLGFTAVRFRDKCDALNMLQEVAENYCVYRNEVHHSAAERTQVLQDVAADPTLPRTKDVQCAECNGQRRGRYDAVLRLLQPKLWASLERLRLWEGLRSMVYPILGLLWSSKSLWLRSSAI
ncbi:unnamed protein product [Linum tenue]|uniref:DNA-directed RNA polymerase II subunit RPB9-like zinc ribbon domain-containing protein n=1 Tax=Linum tenue TaxID=586396 RepID=A0AAV0P7Q9_9ROSI|nr:unnamed protein product [Linum tenue]